MQLRALRNVSLEQKEEIPTGERTNLASQRVPTWNRIAGWLKEIELLRQLNRDMC
jgi:hypothetical protein